MKRIHNRHHVIVSMGIQLLFRNMKDSLTVQIIQHHEAIKACYFKDRQSENKLQLYQERAKKRLKILDQLLSTLLINFEQVRSLIEATVTYVLLLLIQIGSSK